MQKQGADQSFLGRGWSFPVRFDPERNSVKTVGGVEDIEESLVILLKTLPGERVTNLDYGCKLRQLLFEPLEGATRYRMREAVANAIEKFEPRIVFEDVTFSQADPALGSIHLMLTYRVKMTNSRHNLVYPFSELEANYQRNV